VWIKRQVNATELAPLLRAGELRALLALLADVVPEITLDVAWQPLAPRAWRRIVKRALARRASVQERSGGEIERP
jgi:hypothetical protein